MNLLLLEAAEIRRDGNAPATGGEVLLSGRRAGHLIDVLRVAPGDTVRLGVIGGPRGRGRVLEAANGSARLALELDARPPLPPPTELILALPRPIMLQRVLKQAATMGLRRLHLIRSNRVERSFFGSPVLRPGRMRELLLEGMEQARDTWLPEARIHPLFRPFMEDALPGLAGRRLVAHPDAKATLPEVFARPAADEPVLLAVGPEGGWTDHEVESFVRAGFAAFSMGERILHVDTAVVALMAQLDLLRRMFS